MPPTSDKIKDVIPALWTPIKLVAKKKRKKKLKDVRIKSSITLNRNTHPLKVLFSTFLRLCVLVRFLPNIWEPLWRYNEHPAHFFQKFFFFIKITFCCISLINFNNFVIHSSTFRFLIPLYQVKAKLFVSVNYLFILFNFLS